MRGQTDIFISFLLLFISIRSFFSLFIIFIHSNLFTISRARNKIKF